MIHSLSPPPPPFPASPSPPCLSLLTTRSPQFLYLGSGWLPAPSSLSREGELMGACQRGLGPLPISLGKDQPWQLAGGKTTPHPTPDPTVPPSHTHTHTHTTPPHTAPHPITHLIHPPATMPILHAHTHTQRAHGATGEAQPSSLSPTSQPPP